MNIPDIDNLPALCHCCAADPGPVPTGDRYVPVDDAVHMAVDGVTADLVKGIRQLSRRDASAVSAADVGGASPLVQKEGDALLDQDQRAVFPQADLLNPLLFPFWQPQHHPPERRGEHFCRQIKPFTLL